MLEGMASYTLLEHQHGQIFSPMQKLGIGSIGLLV